MKRHSSFATAVFMVMGGVIFPALGLAQGTTDEELLELNEQIFRTMIVERDATLFGQVAVEEFRVVAPGGLIEGKPEAMSGVTAWDVASISVSDPEIVRRGAVAIVLGRIDIDGEMQPVGRWGPLKFMRVFTLEEGSWRLVSQSLTPCLDMLIKMGRC